MTVTWSATFFVGIVYRWRQWRHNVIASNVIRDVIVCDMSENSRIQRTNQLKYIIRSHILFKRWTIKIFHHYDGTRQNHRKKTTVTLSFSNDEVLEIFSRLWWKMTKSYREKSSGKRTWCLFWSSWGNGPIRGSELPAFAWRRHRRSRRIPRPCRRPRPSRPVNTINTNGYYPFFFLSVYKHFLFPSP